MREQIQVTYELNMMINGENVEKAFSRILDKELYYEDIDSFDIMVINNKVMDLKSEYGDDVFLVQFSVERMEGAQH